MAYDDALFQLGMDLTRSSTAQKEDIGEVAPVARFDDVAYDRAHKARTEPVDTKRTTGFVGTHLVIDLFGASRLDDVKHVERTLKRWVESVGASLQHIHVHGSGIDGGISGVVVFDSGHASIRTFPDRAYAAIDVMYMARDAEARSRVVAAAEQAFLPKAVETKVVRRAEDQRRTQVVKPVRRQKVALSRAA